MHRLRARAGARRPRTGVRVVSGAGRRHGHGRRVPYHFTRIGGGVTTWADSTDTITTTDTTAVMITTTRTTTTRRPTAGARMLLTVTAITPVTPPAPSELWCSNGSLRKMTRPLQPTGVTSTTRNCSRST